MTYPHEDSITLDASSVIDAQAEAERLWPADGTAQSVSEVIARTNLRNGFLAGAQYIEESKVDTLERLLRERTSQLYAAEAAHMRSMERLAQVTAERDNILAALWRDGVPKSDTQ